MRALGGGWGGPLPEMEVDRAPGACGARGLSTGATGRPRAGPGGRGSGPRLGRHGAHSEELKEGLCGIPKGGGWREGPRRSPGRALDMVPFLMVSPATFLEWTLSWADNCFSPLLEPPAFSPSSRALLPLSLRKQKPPRGDFHGHGPSGHLTQLLPVRLSPCPWASSVRAPDPWPPP